MAIARRMQGRDHQRARRHTQMSARFSLVKGSGRPLDPHHSSCGPSDNCFLVVGFDYVRSLGGPLHRSAAFLRRRERVVRLAHGHDLTDLFAHIADLNDRCDGTIPSDRHHTSLGAAGCEMRCSPGGTHIGARWGRWSNRSGPRRAGSHPSYY